MNVWDAFCIDILNVNLNGNEVGLTRSTSRKMVYEIVFIGFFCSCPFDTVYDSELTLPLTWNAVS